VVAGLRIPVFGLRAAASAVGRSRARELTGGRVQACLLEGLDEQELAAFEAAPQAARNLERPAKIGSGGG
jgi:hypothetical protein